MIPITADEIENIQRDIANPHTVLQDIAARKMIQTLLTLSEQLQNEIIILQNKVNAQNNIIDKYETGLKAISGLSANLIQDFSENENYLPILESSK